MLFNFFAIRRSELHGKFLRVLILLDGKHSMLHERTHLCLLYHGLFVYEGFVIHF